MGVDAHAWVRGRVLGRGSTASVFLAARATPGGGAEKFAVKSAELSRSGALQREGRMLSSVCSPYVVACLGSDVTAEPDGRLCYNLFLEYVPGGTLWEATKRSGGLDEWRVRLYARGVLRGLAHLHSVGVAHCDVKGQNVLLGEDGTSVKLADMGCARWVGDGDCGGAIGGTPMYMAPEVARGEVQGTAADIWALGCLVIEMATGCPPWSDVEDPVGAIHRIAFSADVPGVPCNVSDDASDFLSRCVKRDPRERWSAEQLLNHPFINGAEEFAVGCLTESKKMSSPKSTLDQFFWDSWAEEEEELTRTPLEPPHERLLQLMGSSSSPCCSAASTWHDGCWFTVRSGTEVGDNGDRSLVSPAAVSCEADNILTAAEEPSAAARAMVLCGCGEESTGCRVCSGVTGECYLLFDPSCGYFISDDDRIRSASLGVDKPDFVVNNHICCSQIAKHDRLLIGLDYSDDVYNLRILSAES